MTFNTQQPIPATVLALELAPKSSGSVAATHIDDFARLLVRSIDHSCSVQRQIRPDAADGLTLVMPPETNVSNMLRLSASAADQFQEQGSAVKMLVHHGLVFATNEGKRHGHIGSAIRSAHSMLRRLDTTEVMMAASSEFVKFAADSSNPSLRFSSLTGTASAEDLKAIVLDEQSLAEAPQAASLGIDDGDLLRFLTRRLAEDIGPFSSVLVESARRSAVTVDALITELGNEVDKAAARSRFIADAQRYLSERRAS